MKRSTKPHDSRCTHCGTSIPYTETSLTLVTPDGETPAPPGVGWVVCGPRCPKLSADQVYEAGR